MAQTVINKEWLAKRQEEIKKDKEENSKYQSLKNGENIIKIDLTVFPVIEEKGKFGIRHIYTTTTTKLIKGIMQPLLLSASPTLDALIVEALANGHNPFTLIKVGEGKDTRYAIKELGE
jgi:hypothetical protein